MSALLAQVDVTDYFVDLATVTCSVIDCYLNVNTLFPPLTPDVQKHVTFMIA